MAQLVQYGTVPLQYRPRRRAHLSSSCAQYLTDPPDVYVTNEPNRRTMTCGLCGHLKRRLGRPPFFAPAPQIEHDAGLYTANWDFHPFGAWLANEAAHHGHNLDDVVCFIYNSTNVVCVCVCMCVCV